MVRRRSPHRCWPGSLPIDPTDQPEPRLPALSVRHRLGALRLRRHHDTAVGASLGARSFSVKMGPPVQAQRWHAKTIKDAIAAGVARRLSDVAADSASETASALVSQLRATGWTRRDSEAGFGDFQPRYVFQIPLESRCSTTCSPASTSCGVAMYAKPRRQVSRSRSEATRI